MGAMQMTGAFLLGEMAVEATFRLCIGLAVAAGPVCLALRETRP